MVYDRSCSTSMIMGGKVSNLNEVVVVMDKQLILCASLSV